MSEIELEITCLYCECTTELVDPKIIRIEKVDHGDGVYTQDKHVKLSYHCECDD